jgi:microcystin-dependent protein
MSTIFPLSASVNQEFDGYRFNGTSWDIIGQEYNPTVYSGTQPSGAKAGDIWIDSSTDVPSISPETILTINAASALYLTQNSASTTYLSQSNASANYATKAYADNSSSVAAAALVDSAPSTLNTLNELAAALGDDANFSTTVTNALSPIGAVTAYALATPPVGWLLCDGSIYSASAYPTLSVGLGSTYGGNGTTTFAVPNLKGRIPVGLDSSQTEFDARGETGGSKTSVAPHDHSISHDHASFGTTDGAGNHQHTQTLGGGISTVANAAGGFVIGNANTSLVSANGGHNHTIDVPNFSGTSGAASAAATSGNLQPYLVMNYIIRAV